MDEEKQLGSFNGVEVEEDDMRQGVPLGFRSLGFRFLPSDFVAFNHYLAPKVRGDNVSTWFIYNIDVYNYEPSHLPELKYGEKTFYFTPRQSKHGRGKKLNRCANGGQGHWKMTSKPTQFKDVNGAMLGKKNTLVYFIKNNNGKDFKTNYIMHEYVLDDSQIDPTKYHKINNVVLCSIYLRKSAEEKKEAQTRKESQQTTRDSNEEDVQQPQPPLMLKGKRPRAEEEREPEPEPQPQPQPQPRPQAYYQNKRCKQLRPWDTAYEDILANVISQQPALIENNASNEFAASMFSPPYMIESQNTYVGNIGCSTDQLPMRSVRKEKNGLEMPLNLPTDLILNQQ
ncbi:unnamed protein product [Camellia sinensis]